MSHSPAGTLSSEEQASLAERIRARDDRAEAEFVALFEGRLRLMIGARIHDRETARDLAQDALIAAIAALRAGSLRESDKLAAFVLGIGRNVANNYIRRRQSGPAEVPLDPETIVAPAHPDGQDRERREIAARALRTLPAADRQILGLILVEGLKPGEIADRLGENVEVIRTRKSRALKKVIAEVARLSRFTLAGH